MTCVASARLTRKAMTRAVKAMAGLYCRSRGYSSTTHAEIVSKAPDTVARQDNTTRLKMQCELKLAINRRIYRDAQKSEKKVFH